MTNAQTAADAAVQFIIDDAPIKGAALQGVAADDLKRQAAAAQGCLTAVDYTATRGSCIDERKRVGLRSGEQRVEPRPSVPGGPNIYALAVAELTDYFGEDTATGEARLARVTDRLTEARIKSGGHEKCAANAGFAAWMRVIAEKPEAVKAYAERQLGSAYDDNAMQAVIGNAQAVIASGRYDDWDETVLARVLGDQAGEAIEMLADVPHEAVTLVRNEVDGATIDHSRLYDKSAVGRGSFVNDENYANMIEHVLSSGPDAVWKKVEAGHAREAILAGVAAAVPNALLYQLRIVPAYS